MPKYLDDPRPDPAVILRMEQAALTAQYAPVLQPTLSALRARRVHIDMLIAMLEAEKIMRGDEAIALSLTPAQS